MTFKTQRHDVQLRQNLFRGLSHLILSLAQVPLPRIGAWRFHNDGTIALSNRPLTCSVIRLEDNGAPRVIQPSETYTCVEPYVSDLLTLQNGYFLAQPNAVVDTQDCRRQMAVQTLLRTLSHHYCDRDWRYGPFVMQFSDFHPSNIFVDPDWNITTVVDFEWVCARPAEMIDVPYWITGLDVDDIGDVEHIEEYCKAREEFMAIFDEEEKRLGLAHHRSISAVMRRAWERRTSWFVHSLDSVHTMYSLFDQHLRSQFISFILTERMEVLISRFWCQQTDSVIERKLREKEKYDIELRRMFGKSAEVAPNSAMLCTDTPSD